MAYPKLHTLPNLTADAARLVDDLEKETDRGIALLGAAFLDDVLDVMIRASFVDDVEAMNKLLGPGRPLESFGSRAHLAYCVGLLGEDIYEDLNLLREIRNDFAHRHPANFNSEQIRSKCERLKCVSALLPDDSCPPRDRLIATVALIVNHLMVATAELKHATPARSFLQNGVLRLR